MRSSTCSSKLVLGLGALLLALTAPTLARRAVAPPPAPASDPRTPPPAGTTAGLDATLLAGMAARSIGPATMSGRVAAIDAVVADPRVIYVGASTGGVWKTSNGGTTWQPVFDREAVAAVGAVAIFQPNPDVVWVGTGEGNPRNSASVGNGVYKSLDGGRTWQHLGLSQSERIARILLHPRDPQVAYVAAMGPTWGEGGERGVYKTVDGGATWQQVLAVDERTGTADLAMDPANPDKLIAALWDHRRWPWFFRSGGPGSGLFLTTDGGRAWRRLTPEDGLPKGPLGRIGVAFAPSDPRVVYALVEAEKNALLRSDDGGYTWRTANDESNVANRPFYYADIRVAPDNPNRVYSLASTLRVSEDGGQSFRTLAGFTAIHPDHHALWLHPQDGRFLINGNDGGIAVSEDRGATWRFIGNLPLAQYYHVRLDQQVPYNVYGGLQDNGSWIGPNQVWENGGIRNHHWQEINFGDGFDTVPDPVNPQEGYALAQEGFVVRWNRLTGEQKSVRPAPPEGEELRFNWNTGIQIDPHDPSGRTLYLGSQYLHKSTDRGDTWTRISPDLTSNNPEWQKQTASGGLTPDVTGAENFTTILTIGVSPVRPGILWVGTDDGRIHVSRDGGGQWTSVEGNLPGVPASSWVPHIAPSPHHEGTAFVVLDDHRRSNWTPYVLRTDDFGQTWRSLATPNLWGYALVIEQDPVDEDLLFLGTEFGLWVSTDGGRGWLRWSHGVPTVSVMDLAIHPRDHDLVIATHGRGLYVLDDIRPLRGLTAAVLAEPLHLFPVPPAILHRVRQTGSSRFPGDVEFRGQNPPFGAVLTFSLAGDDLPHPGDEQERARQERLRQEAAAKKAAAAASGEPVEVESAAEEPAEEPAAGPPRGRGRRAQSTGPEVEIRITGAAGEVIRTFKAPARQGVNRAVWNLRHDAYRRPPGTISPWAPEPSGPEVLPGTYGVTVKFRDHEATGTVEVLPDPRVDVPAAEREAKWAAIRRAGELQELIADAVERVGKARQDVDAVLERARPDEKDKDKGKAPAEPADPRKELRKEGEALKKKLDQLQKRLNGPQDAKGYPYEDDVWSRLNTASGFLTSSWDRPTEAQLSYLARVEAQLRGILDDLNRLFAEDLPAFHTHTQEAGIRLFPEQAPLTLPSGSE